MNPAQRRQQIICVGNRMHTDLEPCMHLTVGVALKVKIQARICDLPRHACIPAVIAAMQHFHR